MKLRFLIYFLIALLLVAYGINELIPIAEDAMGREDLVGFCGLLLRLCLYIASTFVIIGIPLIAMDLAKSIVASKKADKKDKLV